MTRLGTLGTLLDRVRRNRVEPPTRLRLADVGLPMMTPPVPIVQTTVATVPITPLPVSEDSPEIVIAPSSAPAIESMLPTDVESVPPGDSEPPYADDRWPRSDKPTTPGMPVVEVAPSADEAPTIQQPSDLPPDSLPLPDKPLSTPPLALAPEMAAMREVTHLDAPFDDGEARYESEPSPMSASDPLTAPRIIVDEAIAAAADDERTSPFFQVAHKMALESARTVPLEEAQEELARPEAAPESVAPSAPPPEPAVRSAPPPLPTPRDVELTPTPTPPPAPAIEDAVRAGSLKLTPVTIAPMRLEAVGVGEFIGEAQRAVPANFGDAVDASLSLTFSAS